MSNVKNKATIYAVLRHHNSAGINNNSSDVVCCFTKTLEGAERLCGQYTQTFSDAGGSEEDSYFYVVGNIYYDE